MSNGPHYLFLQHSRLTDEVQKYVSSFVQYIASIVEPDTEPSRRIISFLPDRNGVVLVGFQDSTVRVIHRFLEKMDEEKRTLKFTVHLVLAESHRMTSNFSF
ncbi:Type II secretion system (T2SS)-related protein GspDN1 [Andalucia godoyi]|uniref:Type II secretion system (T2SS)-related protein GspDN1 n=1 Tax=Andalucia godoyi TaxID=505711 RepID=A0A8K0AK42_ANDGO|nr:Type II secretion system (T2SS)-related protein GspDN1 [Andalucia godoyi]|eukprot:ANDGO_08764.mRNA.1 Type II secretion system (T2SS)-related protein GspDN1